MAKPGHSDTMEKPGSEESPMMSQNGVQLLLESLSKQVESQGKPPFSPFPPPAQASNSVGSGSPQRIETPPPAQLAFMHVQHPPNVRPIGSSPMPMKPIGPPMSSAAQTNRVWQHLFPNKRIGIPSQPPRDAMQDRPIDNLKPAELSSMGLKQILGKVVDVMELESVLGLNQPSVRPPPGFENFPKPPSQPEKPTWLLQKGGAMPPPTVSGSPQHGVSVLSQWRKPSMEQPPEPKTAPHIDSFVGQPLIASNSAAVGSNRPDLRGKTVPKEELARGSLTKENFQRFWDNFSDPYAHKSKRGPAGQENSIIEASNRLENLALKEKHDPRSHSEKGEEEKEKKKRKSKSKKRSKKSSESAETSVEPPAPVTMETAASPPDGETAPDRKRPRRKSKNKKSKGESGAFEDYWDIDSVMEGLQNGSLIKGEIRINAKNYKECYISSPDDKKDILINGTLDRNRALEGDVVVVEFKSEDEVAQNSQSSPAQLTAKVVYIMEKVHSRYCVGHLTKIGEKDYATLCPRDSRIPRLLIPMTTLSMHIIQNPGAYENILFKAKLVTWDTPNFAQGIIEETLGKKGDIDVETVAILRELHLDGEPVPEALSHYLPAFTISQEEIDRRLDLRKECIFTIDPATARDLDDAVSFKKLGDDLYEVGVHISDVSHFLALGTPLDIKVSERATTIYLVDKAIHMLPLELCLQCSLLPGQDKYAVSVIWQMDSEGNIKDTKFARTVIHSCSKLSYEHAQAIIEGEEVELPALYNNVTPDMIRDSVLGLYKISKHMTKRRFDGGALRIDQPKVCFRVNENAVPTEASLYELKDSNRLIEEFMLRANESVAEYIHSVHPKISLLRRHPPPKAEMMNKLQQALSSIGIDMNLASSGDVHKCIEENASGSRERGIVLSVLCAKPMNRAEYYCNEPDSHHYALNIDMYTHFTSPIRRYVDIVVHRVLCAILGFNELPPWETEDVKRFCKTSNTKKYAAKKAGEMSCEIFTALYIREQGGMDVEGIVQNVISHALDIVVVPLALNTRVYLDRLPAKLDFVDDSANSSLTIRWNHAPDQPITYRLFSTVPVHLKTSANHLNIETLLKPPVPLPDPVTTAVD